MLRIGIAAMDAVAEDRHISHAGLRHHQQLVHRARKAVDHHLGRVGGGIEEQHLAAHLVDCDHSIVSAGHGVIPRLPRIPYRVMPALVAGIHVLAAKTKTWMAGTSPAMTATMILYREVDHERRRVA